MQSDPTESSTSPLNEPFEQFSSSSQYGYHYSDELRDLPLGSNDEQCGRSTSSEESQSLNGRKMSSERREGRLSDADSRRQQAPISPVDRITQYENASRSQSPKLRMEGPTFVIVPSQTEGSSATSLESFPNEVLIHILSHLPASTLSSVSQVSRRFHALVTSPHAWRIAFARYFPGQDASDDGTVSPVNRPGPESQAQDEIRAEQRYFARLTKSASWRSEYILRTKLLRCLARGKPQQIARAQGSRSSNASSNSTAVITYNSHLFTTINHIDARFGDKDKPPHFIHGSDEYGHASVSDLGTGRVDSWIPATLQTLPSQFTELYPGEASYGLGDGSIVGVPNVMDVSEPFGMVYGGGYPGGLLYFRSYGEQLGRFLKQIGEYSEYPPHLPKVPSGSDSMTAVWIAKSWAVPSMTKGLVGIVTGSSSGVVTAYSLGLDRIEAPRLGRGEMTCRWVVSPGVPIVSVQMDDCYNDSRRAAGRVWGVAVNALGEVYCLKDLIKRPGGSTTSTGPQQDQTIMAWETGRSAAWILVESSRRKADHNPYHDRTLDGAYSPSPFPPTSATSEEEMQAQSREIEEFCKRKPAHFRKTCKNWNMRRKLHVDFGGSNDNGAGENVVVIGSCNTTDAVRPRITRYTRVRFPKATDEPALSPPLIVQTPLSEASIFGGFDSPSITPASYASSQADLSDGAQTSRQAASDFTEEWRISSLAWDGPPMLDITADAIDMSKYSTLTLEEDVESVHSVPGHRARHLAVGTKSGTVHVWNMRGSGNTLAPLRVITTDSPQISCLALSSLYLVHGGNDGLVQAWDVLASTLEPIRTLHSRFSSRARRRLVQAEASVQGVGINLFAAGAIALDPDPTVLRGLVSLGTHLRYWAYSSSTSDETSSKKRRLRRGSVRGSNGAGDRYSHTGRGALNDYIANEQHELKREKEQREMEDLRLQGRFGVGLAGLSEEEALKYAEMISQETFEKDEERRLIDTPIAGTPAFSSARASPSPGTSVANQAVTPRLKSEEELADDIKEAIRLSLLAEAGSPVDTGYPSLSTGSSDYDVPFVVKARKGRNNNSNSAASGGKDKKGKGKAKETEIAMDDLEYALQLSLAEEQSRSEAKGKGRGDWD